MFSLWNVVWFACYCAVIYWIPVVVHHEFVVVLCYCSASVTILNYFAIKLRGARIHWAFMRFWGANMWIKNLDPVESIIGSCLVSQTRLADQWWIQHVCLKLLVWRSWLLKKTFAVCVGRIYRTSDRAFRISIWTQLHHMHYYYYFSCFIPQFLCSLHDLSLSTSFHMFVLSLYSQSILSLYSLSILSILSLFKFYSILFLFSFYSLSLSLHSLFLSLLSLHLLSLFSLCSLSILSLPPSLYPSLSSLALYSLSISIHSLSLSISIRLSSLSLSLSLYLPLSSSLSLLLILLLRLLLLLLLLLLPLLLCLSLSLSLSLSSLSPSPLSLCLSPPSSHWPALRPQGLESIRADLSKQQSRWESTWAKCETSASGWKKFAGRKLRRSTTSMPHHAWAWFPRSSIIAS